MLVKGTTGLKNTLSSIIIIIKSDVSTLSHCLELSKQQTIYAVCFTDNLYFYIFQEEVSISVPFCLF